MENKFKLKETTLKSFQYEIFDILSTTVTGKNRKLKARWSPEIENDLIAFHGIDINKGK